MTFSIDNPEGIATAPPFGKLCSKKKEKKKKKKPAP